MSDYLFVYGTLRKRADGCLHPFLDDRADYIGMASMPGKLYEVNNYPGAIVGTANSQFRIQGEVYRLRDAESLFQSLDDYEECSASFPIPHEYRRCKKTVVLAEASALLAWIYLYNRPANELEWIVHGDYRRYFKDRQIGEDDAEITPATVD